MNSGVGGCEHIGRIWWATPAVDYIARQGGGTAPLQVFRTAADPTGPPRPPPPVPGRSPDDGDSGQRNPRAAPRTRAPEAPGSGTKPPRPVRSRGSAPSCANQGALFRRTPPPRSPRAARCGTRHGRSECPPPPLPPPPRGPWDNPVHELGRAAHSKTLQFGLQHPYGIDRQAVMRRTPQLLESFRLAVHRAGFADQLSRKPTRVEHDFRLRGPAQAVFVHFTFHSGSYEPNTS